MEKVCPICNALDEVNQACPRCGQAMKDGGTLQNYLGPYSPYMDGDWIPLNMIDYGCTHLVYCPHCHYDIRVVWNFVII
ncbi:hypothetical protein SDC9_27512 [bioreactor metagenome]|uniref:DZANK-type domain-containing protein n=1 Tax=bioreactor metagenome TaxID=1076179 RepID=A0A644URR5_9ZZZZ|nr:hypothetical protein [Negativicutes bacterium]